VELANENGFHIAVENRAELQFTEYTAEKNGHYDWHHDVQWNGQSGLDRKLSITVQLSGADEYNGGDFEFDELKTNADFRSQGTVLVFPSYLRHKIHPITSGTRRALVAWFFGPKWT
jgi:PKHD-type hydroxylase